MNQLMLDHVQVNWPKEYRHPVDTLSYPSQFDNGVEDGISGFFRAIPIVLRIVYARCRPLRKTRGGDLVTPQKITSWCLCITTAV
jgi:hypothetical protein